MEPWEADLRAVLRVLSGGGQYRVDDLAVGLRVPWHAVRRALTLLVEAGAVVCEDGWYRWTGRTLVTVRVPPTVTCSSPGPEQQRKRGRAESQRRCGVWMPPYEYLRRRRRLVAVGR